MMALWNRPFAAGMPRRMSSFAPPPEQPNTVTFFGSPPKFSMFSFTHCSERMMSTCVSPADAMPGGGWDRRVARRRPGFSQSQQRRLGELVLGQRGGLRKIDAALTREMTAWQVLCLRLAIEPQGDVAQLAQVLLGHVAHGSDGIAGVTQLQLASCL